MVNFSRSSSKSQVRAVRKSGLFKAKHFLLHRALTETWSLEDITVPTAFSNCGDLFLQGLDMGQDPPYCHFQTISLFTPLKQIQFFFLKRTAFQIMPPAVSLYFSGMQVLGSRPCPFLEDAGLCLTALLCTTPTSFLAMSTSTEHTGLVIPWPTDFQWSCPLSDFSYLPSGLYLGPCDQ